MPRGFAHAPILLLIAVILIWSIVFLVFKSKFLDSINLLTPSSDQILIDKYYGWKSYENEKHKFTLKYPTHWYVREFDNFDANFQETDPRMAEATPAAIKVRFNVGSDPLFLKEFEKIDKAQEGEKIREPLDVVSIITKIRGFKVENSGALEYTTDRTFSALQGPPKEFRHTYAIAKDGTILKFTASAGTEEELKVYEKLFQQMIQSFKFY
ncbi:MAG: hypothetical protein AAB639_00890 [Patescibacteria group bacterium]